MEADEGRQGDTERHAVTQKERQRYTERDREWEIEIETRRDKER